jgi:hypothetical protein
VFGCVRKTLLHDVWHVVSKQEVEVEEIVKDHIDVEQ